MLKILYALREIYGVITPSKENDYTIIGIALGEGLITQSEYEAIKRIIQ